MYIRRSNCENMVDVFGNKPRLCMSYWKTINLGIIRIYLGYELYNLIDKETNKIIIDKNNKPYS